MPPTDNHDDPLPDDVTPEDVDFPAVLEITLATPGEAFDEAVAAAEAAEEGAPRPARVSFATAGELRRILTDRRLELLRSLLREPAESISALADRLDRQYGPVHDDVDLLAEYGIVHYREAGQAKQPFVPYERIEFGVTLSADSALASDEAAANP